MPVASAQASVLWTADPSKPLLEEWANVAAEQGRITAVPFASVPYGSAYRVEIREGDDPGGYGERAELALGNPERSGFPVFREGEDLWIAFQFRMQSPYPISEDHGLWNTIFQLHQFGGQSPPPFEIDVEQDKFLAAHTVSETEVGGVLGSWRAEVDKWSKFLMHVKFSSSPTVGFIEMFGELNEDKQGLVPLFAAKMPTIFKQSGVPVPTHARIGTYRGWWSPRPTAVTYYAGFTIATTRSSAEADAFESRPPEESATESSSVESTSPESSTSESTAPSESNEPRHGSGTHGNRQRSRYIALQAGVGRHYSVSLHARKIATVAMARTRHVARLAGAIKTARSGVRRRVRIELRRKHRWKTLAVRTISRRRFSLAVVLPARAVEVRAHVSGVGASRIVKIAG